MNSKLSLIAKQVSRREQAMAPAPDMPSGGLGNAIEQMIEQAVEERVNAALQEQRRQLEASRPPAPTFTDYRQLPPVAKTTAPKTIEATIQRDGAGLARSVTINGVRYLAQRDAAGQLVRMVSEDKVSEVSYNGLPVPPAKANRGN
ncbi:hypothetical protein QTN23_06985 [Pseudomonas shirazica]|uniref:hypothetical protein n=1 Tax=Pseudomonas shirazica TaxID=1940636 RepID=UPI0025A9BA02|nr:hypothetical protein [Pseudomonas shirazica]MDM9599231.1 hypothetical protein [Pseudomonas shirazica]MDO2412659.1 hypothetical protein [Pseudomonas shirazica]